ncbi:hypothetical protein [Glycomyces algeriensis]|uniref:Uncharacterized protein n=1 Tax=Glycomyces algeriensis TaxID=256037 RepID=A0A9W6LJ35_9ACTN|nr:hypothetical protein [Glycomyces algeriensis]MDA1366653.1 hypothetical protein [Glycomyces algeriensis]MDR7352310.1 hypothetical protein [Glycomyces algeriensis]GLI45045.1 hypothetical protein GALLR39Z86_48950 [Glycomyces algeriensis]
MIFGAIMFAATGFPVTEGAAAFVNWAGLAAVLLVFGGFRVFAGGHRPFLGRLGAWGCGLVLAGLAATAVGFIANAAGPLVPKAFEGAVALAAVPAWTLSHLIYAGATVVGIACLRARIVPRSTALLLVASFPLLIAGVSLGLAVGGSAADLITWAATEGQAGLAWALIGALLCRREY